MKTRRPGVGTATSNRWPPTAHLIAIFDIIMYQAEVVEELDRDCRLTRLLV